MRVVFVSLDDTCRGPIAKAIAERLARQSGLHGMVFDSAGVDHREAQPAQVAAQAFMRQEKYFLTNHRSKGLAPQLVDSADVLFCMTGDILTRTREKIGGEMAPKAVLLNEAVILATRRMDIDPPESERVGDLRKIYAALLASVGRLVRMLEESTVRAEDFGAVTIPKKYRPGTGKRAASTADPERRAFLTNTVFEIVERSFEPMTTASIQGELRARALDLPIMEVEEMLQQDLHGNVRLDRDGVWHVVAGAGERRRSEARRQARARVEEARERQRKEDQRKPAEKLSEERAFAVIGVSSMTPLDEARQKYRALLKRYHPDKFHDDPVFAELAKEKAQLINEAWRIVETRLEMG